MIEVKGQTTTPEAATAPAPKKAEALPPPATATEMYLNAILQAVQSISALIAIGQIVAAGKAEADTTEPVEVELTEPAETVTSKRKKKS